MNRGADIWNSSVRSFPLVRICRTRSGSRNGSPLRNRSLINEKIAVFNPIPSARVSTAMQVNAGDLRSWRSANFTSVILFGAQSLNRVDTCSAARREQTGRQCDRREQNCCAAEQHWVVRRNLIELRRDQPAEREGGDNAQREAGDHRLHSLAHDEPQDIARLRAERHADADLAGALLDGVGNSAVNPNAREQERNAGENAEQPHHQPRLTDSLRDDRAHRLRQRDREIGIDGRERGAHQLRYRVHAKTAAHIDAEERKALLRPRPVEFHVVGLGNLSRAHVADDADDLRRRAVTADEQRLADRIFAAKNLLRTGLADQDHVLTAVDVVLIEIAPGQKRNAKGPEVIRCNVVEDGGGTLVDGENLAVGPRIKRVAYAGWNQRNVRAHRRALDTRRVAQCGQSSFRESLPPAEIWVARLRQSHKADPEILAPIPDVL